MTCTYRYMVASLWYKGKSIIFAKWYWSCGNNWNSPPPVSGKARASVGKSVSVGDLNKMKKKYIKWKKLKVEYVLWKREAVILLMIQLDDVIGGIESSRASSGTGLLSSNIPSEWLRISISRSTRINASQIVFHLPNTSPTTDFGRPLRMWSSCCMLNGSSGMVPNLFSKS